MSGYFDLIVAGYRKDQILSCPYGDPCPCQTRGPQHQCGLSGMEQQADSPLIEVES